MKRIFKITKNNASIDDCHMEHEVVNTCPICKAKIDPVYMASSLDTEESASVFNYCRSCENAFVTKYCVAKVPSRKYPIYYETTEILYSEPQKFSKVVFDAKVTALSPQFDKIYNQALAAEYANLDEIAGLGYRKAMEFLIKDFAIHEHPEAEDTIKKAPLSQCIQKYISTDNIKILAERSTWIGNDEAHYVRKQEDRDVSDMKAFIQACVYFIGMILITEDAASMTPKK